MLSGLGLDEMELISGLKLMDLGLMEMEPKALFNKWTWAWAYGLSSFNVGRGLGLMD